MEKNLNYPNIGQSIDRFVERFGEPISESETLTTFNLGSKEFSYLSTVNLNGDVNNISLSMKTYDNTQQIGIELLANQFLPIDAKPIKEIENTVIEEINSDVPVSIYEYYSESAKESKGLVGDRNEQGYITVYICHEKDESSMVVTLGREEAIQ